jgi:hypothetical protein
MSHQRRACVRREATVRSVKQSRATHDARRTSRGGGDDDDANANVSDARRAASARQTPRARRGRWIIIVVWAPASARVRTDDVRRVDGCVDGCGAGAADDAVDGVVVVVGVVEERVCERREVGWGAMSRGGAARIRARATERAGVE